MKVIRVHRTGGAEVLGVEESDVPEPGSGEVRVRVAYAGVNFLDIYHRSGLYPRQPPFTPGEEGAGVVDAVGEGVADVRAGDRVAWVSHPGGYAEYAIVPAAKLTTVPEDVSFEMAAAVMLQGMTAHYLTHDTFPLAEGDVALAHAAAGGVGRLLVQMARLRGAVVIGTVSTEEKAEVARAAGAQHVVLYTRESFLQRAVEVTGGRGVDVVYDSVGKATWEDSMRSLRPRGMLVLFGNASGPVPPLDPLLLSRNGSLFLTRPTLAHHIARREELVERAGTVLGMVGRGELRVRIDRVLPLAEAAEAHRLLESRRTAGKLLLSC